MEMIKTAALILSGIMLLSGCRDGDAQKPETSGPSAAGAAAGEMKPETEKAPAKEHKGFYVDGTKLYDANGNEFIMRGINHEHTWYKDKLDVTLEAIAGTGANCVRIVLSNGHQWQKDSEESVSEIIDKCKALEMAVILEVHDGTGKEETEVLDGIADYWAEIKGALIGNEKYAILNIANEWTGSWNSGSWAEGYVSAIKKIRAAGIENLIMVDAAGWGQYGQSVADKGNEVFAADELHNTMFSVHMYGTAGGSKSKIKKNIDSVLKNGLCLCIGEFGHNHSDGDVDEEFIKQYCCEKGVGYLAWAWKGNSGGVEYLDIAKEWDGSELSGDWGEPLINGENGIRKTAKKCSVFG